MSQSLSQTTTLFFLLFLFPTTLSQNTTFTFPSFTLRNITLLGDSFLRNGVVGLTRSTTVPASSSGTLLYNNPISHTPNSPFSFSTNFTFSITNSNPNPPSSSPNHLSFFLNSSTPFISLDFHTNNNQISLFFNNSVQETIDFNLTNTNLITSWIDYNTFNTNFTVFLSYANENSSFSKPEKPVLNVEFNLSEYFNDIEFLYVGFLGSALGSTELQQIMNWSFQTSQFPSLNQTQDKNSSFHHFGYEYEDVPVSNSTKKGHGKRFVIGLCVAIVGPSLFFVLFFVLGYFSYRKWSSLRKVNKSKNSIGCPTEFGYKELRFATKGFHGSRIIGNGSFGTVYKALFVSSGTVAAVKRSRHSHEGKTEFLSELSIIAGLRHKNLVQLLGWCVEKGELLLVYEFMENGSLDKWLYREGVECGVLLSWVQRFNIVVGLASVLAYLHQECEQRVIHRDIKTANILLDGNLNPRLGDFGLAKLMDHDKSPVSTLTAGTMGYLAPEYLQYGKATDKTDVFSFGVVVLEVACGRRPIDKEGQEIVNLVDFVWGLYAKGKIINAVDKRLNGEFDEVEMEKMLMLGLSCANPNGDERPSMRRVLQILNNEGVPLVVPKVKPCLSFSSGLLLTLDEIVSDFDERFCSNQYSCKIQIEPSC
ncbi:probable L-type lectin-domain containing receptor kinase S.7 [Vicia villosa]|uniref:probable L-type lectin-domain containing receptor kinase S.7 n=1 Tax=Vicia villosa TaxID=3911 RepID=UPI00273C3E1B|nr:probable L-type lectin-domain containing receptor kinase S.7 [Vicia villosa]